MKTMLLNFVRSYGFLYFYFIFFFTCKICHGYSKTTQKLSKGKGNISGKFDKILCRTFIAFS